MRLEPIVLNALGMSILGANSVSAIGWNYCPNDNPDIGIITSFIPFETEGRHEDFCSHTLNFVEMIETTYNQSIQQIQDLFEDDAGLNCDAIDMTTSNSNPEANYCRRLRDTKCQLESLGDSYAYVEGLFDICPKASEPTKEDKNLVQLLNELSNRAAEKESTSPDPAGLPAISEEVCDVEGLFIMGDNSNDLRRYFSRSIQALDHLIASYESIQAVSGSDFVGTISMTINADNIASGTFGGGIETFLNIALGNIHRISNLKAFLQFYSDLLEYELGYEDRRNAFCSGDILRNIQANSYESYHFQKDYLTRLVFPFGKLAGAGDMVASEDKGRKLSAQSECGRFENETTCNAHGVNHNCCSWESGAGVCKSKIKDNICVTDSDQLSGIPGQNGASWTGTNACAAQHHAYDCINVGDDNDCCEWVSGSCVPSTSIPDIAINICKITREFLKVEKLNGKGCNGIDDDGDSVIDTDFTFNGETVYSSDANYLIDECSEDVVPPTISFLAEKPASFISKEHARQWFLHNTEISDDCTTNDMLKFEVNNIDGSEDSFELCVEDKRCGGDTQWTREAFYEGGLIVFEGNYAVDDEGHVSYTNTYTCEIHTFKIDQCSHASQASKSRDLRYEGCNNVDDDCDSNFINLNGTLVIPPFMRVDECDEDKVAPTIRFDRTPPVYFLTEKQGHKWFEDHAILEDDCAQTLSKEVVDKNSTSITLRVYDPTCYLKLNETGSVNGISQIVDGEGAASNVYTFRFAVDQCPYLPYTSAKPSDDRPPLRGEGCDGLDNDCDSNFLENDGETLRYGGIEERVDECDEDRVPPSLKLAKDPPTYFLTPEQAYKWFTENVVAEDDCVPVDRLDVDVKESTPTSITFTVTDPRCFENPEVRGYVNGDQGVVVDGPGAPRSEVTFDFVIDQCPYLPYTTIKRGLRTRDFLKGEGCDGLDNDCDSNFLDEAGECLIDIEKWVDECDEDMTPPVITLDESVEIPETFPSLQSAIDFYMNNTEQEDDCTLNENLIKTYTTSGPNTCGNASIEITVCTPCFGNQEVNQTVNGEPNVVVDGEGRPCDSVTYEFIVDDKAPIVTCGFHKLQDIYFVRDSNFIPDGSMTPPEPADGEPLHVDYHHILKDMVNVEFWYQIEEIDETCPHEKVDVDVTVLSNEVERKGREMVDFFTERNIATINSGNDDPVDRLTLFLAPHTCHDHNANKDRSTNCLIEKDLDQNMREANFTTRFYDVKVEATDTTGNVGSATCTVIVVPEDHYCDQDPSSYRCKKTKSSKAGRAGKYGANSSKGKGYLPTPTDPFALVYEYELSTKRFVIGSEKLVWDTSIDTRIGVATPAPTGAPTGKGKGKGSSGIKKTTKKSPDVVEIEVSSSANLN